MRRMKGLLTAAVLGFLVFAPPGTLILTALLLAGLFGATWAVVVVAVAVAVIVSIYLADRQRRRRSRASGEP